MSARSLGRLDRGRRRVGLRLAALAGLALAGVAGASSCSLGNVAQDDCGSDDACVAAFGLGSRCEEGYCSEAPRCETSSDCRASLGLAVTCSSNRCARAALDPRCSVTEPEELGQALAEGGEIGDVLLMGALLTDDGGNQGARIAAMRLAVREMNASGGAQGRTYGLVVCDPAGSESDPAIVEELVLHLGDAIGAPVVLGPSSTADVIVAVNAVLAAELPVAIVSPSATGEQLGGQPDRLDPSDELGLLWRTAPSDELQAEVLADVIAEALDGLDAPIVASVHQADPYGVSLERLVRDALVARVPDVVVEAHGFAVDGDLEAATADAVADAAGEAPNAVVVLAGRADRAALVLQAAAGEPALATLPFFLSDGAKDATVLLATGDEGVDAILATALGTAPANPQNGSFFDALENAFGVEASQFGFVAHAYDAAYVAGLGLARASRPGATLDGRSVVEGFSRLSGSGATVELGPIDFSAGVAAMLDEGGTVDIAGESGPLDFDATTGEAPGAIEVWRVSADGAAFEQVSETIP